MKRERQRDLAILALVPRLARRDGRASRPCLRCRSEPRRPATSFFAGLTSACQREPSRRFISVASIFGSVSRPMRRPFSWAEITLVSFTTSWSPGSSHCGSSATSRSRKTPSGCTTSIRAESRGLAGRSAMLPAGSSKSKRSVRMARRAPSIVSQRHSGGRARARQSGISSFRVQPCGLARNDGGR